MALAESVLRKVHKLGLIPKIIRLLPIISFVLALSSLSWLLSLPMDGNYRNTYISENALMPSQVTSYFRESEWNIVRGYRSEIKQWDFDQVSKNNEVVSQWLADLGLEPIYHANKHSDHDTLYTILHAPRGDNTEAMVLTIPWFTSDQKSNVGGLSLGLALARYFKKMSIWSKNIILVFPPDGHASLRSWVEAYHTTLDNTAGAIEAAIVMEYASDSDHFHHYAIEYQGLNGQLPNLDLINTANNIGYHENLHCSIQGTPAHELTKNTYFTRLRTLVRGVVQLTLAGLSRRNVAGCESFSGWQIQAFTIRAVGSEGNADITQFGRIVDSTLRSVNNLLEKFHQSFFFYLLLSSKHFVSIGTYLPSAIMMAVAFAVSALGCFLYDSGSDRKAGTESFFNKISQILTIFVSVATVCLTLSLILPLAVRVGSPSSDEQDLRVWIILGVLTVLSVVLSVAPAFNKGINGKFDSLTTHGLMGLSLFIIALVITTLLIVHFSLALSIGLVALPLTFIQPLLASGYRRPSASLGKSKLKVCLSLLVSNPIFVIIAVGYWYLDQGEGVIELMRGLLTSWDELQCWTWFVVMVGWLPCWTGVAVSCAIGEFGSDGGELEEKKQQ